jgi:mono/diheme cytochrome c family protein
MQLRHIAAALLLAFVPLAAHAQGDSAQMPRGEYLTRAADCQACHTAPGGVPFAGGRAFVLPFGVIYSPDITPSADGGIAGYTDDQWVHMLHQGVARGGKHLYPVMPYDSYTGMSREDALAIKTYLMSLAPVPNTIPADHLRFPYNQRWTMFFWNLVNNPDRRFQPDGTQNAAYNRGAYLVQVLGHCGECHTPRNFMLAMATGKQFAGSTAEGWLAYNITPDKLTGIGNWSDADLAQYLSTGYAPGHGPASGPMAEAVEDSLRYLKPDDIQDMVLYLRHVKPQVSGPPAVDGAHVPLAPADTLGPRIFAQACEGCHLTNGQGRQSPWAALAGAETVGDPAGTNIVQILSQGSHVQTKLGLMFMHPFTGDYTDDELAAVANYTISQFGGRRGHVTPKQIQDQRDGKPDTGKQTS